MTKEEHLYLQQLGKRIALRRKELKIKQTSLGEKVKLSRIHIYRIERGLHPTTIIVLKRIAKELGMSISELVDVIKVKN